MSVRTGRPGLAYEHEGSTYHFCCPACLAKFSAAPEDYLNRPRLETRGGGAQQVSSASKADTGAPRAGVYTCPMHPEVEQMGPGACPKCGMDLELKGGDAGGDTPELRAMTQRFWAALALTAPLFALAMGDMALGGALSRRLPRPGFDYLQMLLAMPVVVWGGGPFFKRGWASIASWNLNMFTLIALGTGTAFAYSIIATLAPGVFPSAFQDAHGHVPVYFESATVIIALVLLGQVLELRARQRTTGAIRGLLELAPGRARRIKPDGTEEDVPIEEVQTGDLLRIRPGEKVPVDGEAIDGRGAVDESMITGESMPVQKTAGAQVTGGTVNQQGGLVMRAERVGQDTVLARIVRMVQEAQRTRAPIQRVADTVAAYFVPAVALVSAATFILWAWLGPSPSFAYALVNAVAVLIVACPCAMGLATPMAIMVGVGRGAGEGVLIKNAEALETLERVDVIVVDKTGTLTEGSPRVTAVFPVAEFREDEILALAASLERASEHPLASAIVREAEERSLALAEAEDFDSLAGKGVVGHVQGRRVAVGNAELLDEQSIERRVIANEAAKMRDKGQTVIFIAVDGRLAGLLGVADPIRKTTPEALDLLRADGVTIHMLTGDNERTAEAVAAQLGIEHVEADVLPEHKHDAVRRLREEGHVVAMAGDGVNDAPALAAAHVGIAMGSGTDIAVESAGITLIRGDLRAISRARRLSHATMRTIRQNLFFAFLYNGLGVPIAAGVLYPFFGLLLSPMIAAAAMSFSSVSVIGNSLRLRKVNL